MDALRLPSTTPRVSRSNALVGMNVIAIEGAQFEDGLRRIVVGPEISDESMKSIEEALKQIEFEEDRRRWLLELVNQNLRKDGQR